MLAFLFFTVVPSVIAFSVMRKEKATVSEGKVDESPLSKKMFWAIFGLSWFAPIVAQTIFYYGWKKQLPNKAKKANKIGWTVLAILFVFYIVLTIFAPTA